MGRAYKMKGQKRKKKEEKYDREEDVQVNNKKTKTSQGSISEQENSEVDDMPGIPIVLPINDNNKPGVIFVIENASLEVAKVGKKIELLSSDSHASYLTKHKRDPSDYRPDIAFQAIQGILDSRLNKSGRLKALYVRTQRNQLILIKPHCRMPRTFKRFAGLMVELLSNFHIKSTGNDGKLLDLVKGPVTRYLPANSRKIGFSHSSEKLVDMQNYVAALNNDLDLVFVVGAMSHGKIEIDYVEDYLSISEYPLSATIAVLIINSARSGAQVEYLVNAIIFSFALQDLSSAGTNQLNAYLDLSSSQLCN